MGVFFFFFFHVDCVIYMPLWKDQNRIVQNEICYAIQTFDYPLYEFNKFRRIKLLLIRIYHLEFYKIFKIPE